MATTSITLPRRLHVPPATVAVSGWAALILAGHLLGARLVGADPLVHIGAAPFVGRYAWHASAWLVPALLLAAFAVARADQLAASLPWRRLLLVTWAAALAWAVLLALGDGPGALGLPLTRRFDYLAALPQVHSPADFLGHFTERLGSYPTHVKGHPPGLVLTFWALARAGLGGAGVATAFVLAVGALAAPAAVVTVRARSGEAAARRAAPFVSLAPAAVWVATSGDAVFLGVSACGIAALATRRAFTGGLLLGVALLLTYGAAPLALVALAVAARRDLPRAAAGVALPIALAAAFGFWWLDGLHATRALYDAGVASRRPYADFLIIAPAALAAALGPAVAVALRQGTPLVLSAVAAVLAADLSGLSRGENERIWLTFTPWLLAATAGLTRHRRAWLAAQLTTALTLQLVLRSPW